MEASMIKKIVDDSMPQMVSDRRYLHKHPELSFEEYQTTEFLCRELASAGITDVKRPLKTGVVATIHGAYPGKKVAIRADIDALPIQEKNELEFCSVNDGVMMATQPCCLRQPGFLNSIKKNCMAVLCVSSSVQRKCRREAHRNCTRQELWKV